MILRLSILYMFIYVFYYLCIIQVRNEKYTVLFQDLNCSDDMHNISFYSKFEKKNTTFYINTNHVFFRKEATEYKRYVLICRDLPEEIPEKI